MSETENEPGTEEETSPLVPDDDPDQDEGAEEEETPAIEEPPDGVDPETGEVTDEAALQEAQAASIEQQDREMAQLQRKLVRKATSYAEGMVKELGPDMNGFVGCPLCADFYPGFRLPIMPDAPALAATRVAIGLEPGDNLPADGYSRKCDSCDGWGFVDSGSRVSGQARLMCIDCEGRGWKAVGTERENGSVTGGQVVALPTNPGPPAVSSNDPPEVEKLKQLGYVVVSPIAPLEVQS